MSTTSKQKTGNKKPAKKDTITVNILSAVHQRATLACNLVQPTETLLEFLSRAADDRSAPILKKHGVKLSDDAAVSSRP